MTVCAAAKNRSHRYKQDIKTLPAVNAARSVLMRRSFTYLEPHMVSQICSVPGKRVVSIALYKLFNGAVIVIGLIPDTDFS